MLIGLLSDAHGNAAGFFKGIDILEEHKVDSIYFLGDAIGYIPIVDVVYALREKNISCVMGNHEAMLLSGAIDKDKDVVYQLENTKKALDEKDISYLSKWQQSIEFDVDNLNIMLVHGSLDNPTYDYVYPDSDLVKYSSCTHDVVFMGNTHYPFVREVNGKLFVNIGSCGLPRDTSGMASVCLFDTKKIEPKIIRYDISKAAESIMKKYKLHPSVIKHLMRSKKIDEIQSE